MKHLKSVTIQNYRSITELVEIPLTSKMTFIVGPNNTGKTNVLRAFATLSSGGQYLEDGDFADLNDKQVRYNLSIDIQFLRNALLTKTIVSKFLEGASNDATFDLEIIQSLGSSYRTLGAKVFEFIPKSYFERNFSEEFRSAGSIETNIRTFSDHLSLSEELTGTVLVPSLRFIATPGFAVPHFGQKVFPGQTIDLTNLVENLRKLCNPKQEERSDAERRLTEIYKFMEFCLECGPVKIRIPHDNGTVLVAIDGPERAISNLGSGIEQLLVIAAGAYLFPDKLVLIEEPEHHFHPRVQKRMIQYLAENSSSKFLVSTHSAAILDAVDSDIVRLRNEYGQCRGIPIRSSHDKFNAIRDLGHSPSELIQANFVIWVEGPSDRIYLNSWIRRVTPEFREGVDYTFIFYGGSVLSQHDFSGDCSDFLNALSVARQFALVMDRDTDDADTPIRTSKLKAEAHANAHGAVTWVTAGREIENYIPESVLVRHVQPGLKMPVNQYSKLINSEKINKVEFAKKVVAEDWQEWPLDLSEKVSQLVAAIRAAR